MKKIIAGAAGLAFAGGLLLAPNASADPSDQCPDDAPVGQTENSLSVCVDGVGATTASGDAETQQGYIVADGDSNEDGEHQTQEGYIGTANGGIVSSSCDEDYSHGESEIQSPDAWVQTFAEFVAGGGEGACDDVAAN